MKTVSTTILAATGLVMALGALAPAKADRDDWRGNDWRRHERHEAWRERQWREHEWRERHRYGYAPPPYVVAPPRSYSYYTPPPPPVYYSPGYGYAPNPGVSFGFTVR